MPKTVSKIIAWYHRWFSIPPKGRWAYGSCCDWISSGFHYRCPTEEDKVAWIFHCLDHDDPVMRKRIYDVIENEFPQYQTILDNQEKWRLLI